MSKKKRAVIRHPKGEREITEKRAAERVVDSYGGQVQVSWDPEAAVTPYGQLVFFVEFLKTAGIFDSWVNECPLKYTSNNAPLVRDVLGTLMLSLLAGHRRYAHIAGIRCDQVTPGLLGMEKVVSEDSARRGLLNIGEEEGANWLKTHLSRCSAPLLRESWILDIDTTVKVLYGHQEGAVLGYNPQKPGRPSHVYHTYFAGNLRLILDAEVQAGNQSSAFYAQPGLWSFIDSLPKGSLPAFLRGDCGWGNESMMSNAESRGLDFLLKLKQSPNVKKLISRAFGLDSWQDAGQGWEGLEERLELSGWSKSRRVIVLRRRLKEPVVIAEDVRKKATQLAFLDVQDPASKYEYAVLVTSLNDGVLTLAQHYRDRADSENIFDEMKNQWGWGGYTTADLGRCKLMARISALVFNWWSLFSNLAFPDKHKEAITSRPLLLHAVGRQTQHAGQTKLTLTSSHGSNKVVRHFLDLGNAFLARVRTVAEQLTDFERWQLILSRVFVRFLHGRILGGMKLQKIYLSFG